MIQEIGAHVLHNEWLRPAPLPEDRVYVFRGRETLVDAGGLPPTRAALGAKGEYLYLFSVDETHCYLFLPEEPERPELPDGLACPEGYAWKNARLLRRAAPMERALAGFTATHLANWYRQNRFCGCCGGELRPGTRERNLVCPRCGNLVYPRLNPAVIVAVTDGERLLMTRYANRPSVRHFVLIAGFVEIGETAEQCVAREVHEEVGLSVKNIRYAGSQPWGCDGNLTLGYYCELSGADTITLQLDELGEARWFRREEVPVPDDPVSITAHMIRAFREGREWETPFS